MPGESCENASPSLGRRMSLNGEKLLKREKPRELIFPSNYDLLRHLQYATHFPIPLVSHCLHQLTTWLFRYSITTHWLFNYLPEQHTIAREFWHLLLLLLEFWSYSLCTDGVQICGVIPQLARLSGISYISVLLSRSFDSLQMMSKCVFLIEFETRLPGSFCVRHIVVGTFGVIQMSKNLGAQERWIKQEGEKCL